MDSDAACIGDDDLLRFVSGALDDARTAEIRSHVDACDDCRELLAIAGKEAAASETCPPETPAGEPRAAAPRSDDLGITAGAEVEGRFRIDREIGRGGMGVVYAATHLALRRRVAVKVLKATGGDKDEAVARFLRETRVASKLVSPHAVRVLDVGRLRSGAPFMVMELLEGKNLERVVAEGGELEVEVAVRYVLQACHAIGEAHDAGIVHRDVTLSNLFLADASPEPIVKVLDFGLAKGGSAIGAQSQLTRADAMMGTPLYMSPEQLVSSRDVDARADVWALGVALYRLVTAAYPFRGPHLLALLARMMGGPPELPTKHRPDLAPGIERVIMRCLSRDLAERYPNAKEVGAALSLALEADETVTATAAPRTRPLVAPIVAPVVAEAVPETLPLRPPSVPDLAPAPPAPPPILAQPAPPSPRAAPRWPLAATAALALLMASIALTAFLRRSSPAAPDPAEASAEVPAQVTAPEVPIEPEPPLAEATPPPVPSAAADEPSAHLATDTRPRASAQPARRGSKPVPAKPDPKAAPPAAAASSNGRLYEKM